ncbi:MAG: glucose-6-phosphate dehydrogenase assembly protein OpcA [Candidatus Eremiobacteraeota bacterium]|nr:glucose-6-phosphate dehydrogenase assembly protein OpcA [Candidatus Eremiobacteraeota bacterium]MBV8372955.1 glucose-6-phosphate dehydrogenase assembly protein OpcA [Candidatus Eremiobacteraeota bacterium]
MSIDLRSVLGELSARRKTPLDHMDVALMTLVAFFEDAAIGSWLRDRIHSLAVKHPSRVILLDATQAETAHQVGSVTCDRHAECLKTRGEWMELGVAGSDPATLRSVITTLALPQVPVVMIWASATIGQDPRFAEVASLARTIVYNSSALGTDEGALCQLVEFVHAHPDIVISDLAYLRLAPWQESIALFFDAKAVIRELFDLRRVEISSGSSAEAYYLLGWLASRLEWKSCAANRFCNRFGTEIEFALTHDGPPRRIARVALHSSHSDFIAELKPDDPNAIVLTVTGAAAQPERCHPMVDLGTAALIERAILMGNKDRVFHDTLRAASDILACR